eukprot:430792_1
MLSLFQFPEQFSNSDLVYQMSHSSEATQTTHNHSMKQTISNEPIYNAKMPYYNEDTDELDLKEYPSNAIKGQYYFTTVYFKNEKFHVNDDVMILIENNNQKNEYRPAQINSLYIDSADIPIANISWYNSGTSNVVTIHHEFYHLKQYNDIPKDKLLFLNKTPSESQNIPVASFINKITV